MLAMAGAVYSPAASRSPRRSCGVEATRPSRPSTRLHQCSASRRLSRRRHATKRINHLRSRPYADPSGRPRSASDRDARRPRRLRPRGNGGDRGCVSRRRARPTLGDPDRAGKRGFRARQACRAHTESERPHVRSRGIRVRVRSARTDIEAGHAGRGESTRHRGRTHLGRGTPGDRSAANLSTSADRLAGSVLVVEDDHVNRLLLRRSLEADGHTVTVAEHGRLALELLESTLPDVILLDILMPELDGFAVLDTVKADPRLRDIPVIMISALDEMDSVVRCIEAGAEDYLPKPFDVTLLRARINAGLMKRRLDQVERDRVRDVFARFLPETVVDEV